MKAANDNFIFKPMPRASIDMAEIERMNKRAEFMGTLYLCFAGVMLGGIVGLFIRGL